MRNWPITWLSAIWVNRAFRLLHANAELIALGMTRYWKTEDGGISFDVAPFVAALECATGRKALVFGKPAAKFFQSAVERLSLAPDQVLMIGDPADVSELPVCFSGPILIRFASGRFQFR